MKALCNMKVNGRWVKAGEEYGIPVQAQMKLAPEIMEEPGAPAENAEAKPARKRTPRKKTPEE